MEQVSNGITPILSNYQLRLPAYEGPLDVLLRLIERSQLAIEDVSLVAITAQFFAYVKTLRSASSSVMAEFATVGSRLTLLKSRTLLPRPSIGADEPEQSDLTYQLREYRRVMDLARRLGELHACGNVAHGPAVDGAILRPTPKRPPRLASHDVSVLVRSLRRRLIVMPKVPQVIKQRRVVSLRDLVAHITFLVSRSRSVQFSRIVAQYQTRTEVATAFLAVLVLVRRQSIQVAQYDLFGGIALSAGAQSDGATGGSREHEFVN
jgi:segregation and condensation protein A